MAEPNSQKLNIVSLNFLNFKILSDFYKTVYWGKIEIKNPGGALLWETEFLFLSSQGNFQFFNNNWCFKNTNLLKKCYPFKKSIKIHKKQK